MEEQILRYCLNLIKRFFFIILFIFFSFFLFVIYFLQVREYNLSGDKIKIIKNSGLKSVSSLILIDNTVLEKEIYYYYLGLWDRFIKKINYGEFEFEEPLNLIKITKIISNPSNVYHKFTIVDGWQEYQLNNYFNNTFGEIIELEYLDILADTYNYTSTDSMQKLVELMKKNKDIFFKQNSNNELMKKYSINEIMTIASLLEREGIDDFDKKIISSVIFNRLNKKMKLQIDASTIFSITKGKYKFDRKLSLDDLKIKDQYNTYVSKNLPPKPICYVSRKTIEIVLENYKSNYLFYFYDKNLKKHIFSKTYNEHNNKLINYRKKNAK